MAAALGAAPTSPQSAKRCGVCRRSYDVAGWNGLVIVKTLPPSSVQAHLSVPAAWTVELRRCTVRGHAGSSQRWSPLDNGSSMACPRSLPWVPLFAAAFALAQGSCSGQSPTPPVPTRRSSLSAPLRPGRPAQDERLRRPRRDGNPGRLLLPGERPHGRRRVRLRDLHRRAPRPGGPEAWVASHDSLMLAGALRDASTQGTPDGVGQVAIDLWTMDPSAVTAVDRHRLRHGPVHPHLPAHSDAHVQLHLRISSPQRGDHRRRLAVPLASEGRLRPRRIVQRRGRRAVKALLGFALPTSLVSRPYRRSSSPSTRSLRRT